MYLKFGLFVMGCLVTGCYSFQQGYGQLKLLTQQVPLLEVLATQAESPEKLKKLKMVPLLVDFAQKNVGLTLPTGSYKKYISLKEPFVSWVVQAASQRSLELKTWWFPFIGTQPYLGFFHRHDALEEQKNLSSKGYDTVVGGVSAFSLLGYYPDPLYSSFLENKTLVEFIETFFHECVHLTIYLPNFYSFNENLANFIAKKATVLFLSQSQEYSQELQNYFQQYEKNEKARKKFEKYLVKIKKDLNDFYNLKKSQEKYKNLELFLAQREIQFYKISNEYKVFMATQERGTPYEFLFQKEKINNAVILSYFVYESQQELFEDAFLSHQKIQKQEESKQSLHFFVKKLRLCFSHIPKKEKLLWEELSVCHKTSVSF